jgi:actin-like ATPase involved in cell morphogenesis
MTFGLGVDLGTTFTAAAVSRGDQPEMVTLGDRAAAIPSVVMIREDGSSLIGDAAHRRAVAQPARVAREVKRRLGDPTPLILGGEPHSAAQILSRLLRAAVDAASAREGRRPDGIVLTHPANWGPYKRELFDSVPRLADLTAVSMVTEPEAAAAHYASTARVTKGSVVAVYDLGGGTFDATVLHQLDDGFEFLGPPEGIEGLGGIDFDEAVFAHVDRSLDGALSELDLDDPRAASSLVRVRQDCVLAKEALSGDTETTVPVLLPNLHTEVRLTRGEFEEMIRAPVEATVSALRRALTAADVTPEKLSNVLLVGGSSRIPLVSQMLSAELGRPTAVDTHPKHAVALGAALLATRRRAAGPRTGPPGRGMPGAPPPGRPAAQRPRTPVAEPGAAANATVVAKPSKTPAPVRASGSSGRLPVVGPPSGGPRGMRPPPGSVPIAPPSAPFRASHGGPTPPPGGPPSRPGGPTPPPAGDRRRGEGSRATAAGAAPPSLGSTSAEAAETRRRRIRIGVLCGVAAVVLAGGGVATAAALTGHSGGATIPPPAASVAPTTTAKPQGAAPIRHVPTEPAKASGGGSEPSSLRHEPTTPTSRTSASGGRGGSGQ